ncbi:MAG: response regulator [Candidatus Aminicenantes bacterium]|nr:response regulator [Candidatus Aminicenantes bacterium]
MKKVLIVEDEGIVSLDLKNTLSTFGKIESEVAFTAEDAMNMIKKNRPDLVLMDIGLKGNIDGIQAAEMVIKDHKIPLVFLTGFADSSTEKKANSISPDGYMTKPVDEDKLRKLIQQILFDPSC